LTLVGCGADGPPQATEPPAREAKQDGVDALPEPTSDPQLIPLYRPDQVLGSLPRGRQDPFAPPPEALVAAQAESADSGADGDVALMGVSSVGGAAQAFVSYGSHSGPVALGDEGGPGLPWLPTGVSVADVDVQRGRLLLQRDGRPLSPLQL
tara:strand:+ start:1385 stop:1840 length:456 start_codon:yes stop_codon:yes gene_type:complete